MTKTLRDVASVLYDVDHSVSCKICVKCKIYKENEHLSCLDCIEDGLEVLINKLTPKKPVLGESWKDCCKTIYDEDGFILSLIHI